MREICHILISRYSLLMSRGFSLETFNRLCREINIWHISRTSSQYILCGTPMDIIFYSQQPQQHNPNLSTMAVVTNRSVTGFQNAPWHWKGFCFRLVNAWHDEEENNMKRRMPLLLICRKKFQKKILIQFSVVWLPWWNWQASTILFWCSLLLWQWAQVKWCSHFLKMPLRIPVTLTTN